MIGDAAYGIILALATGYVIMKFKPQGMAGKLLKLLFLGGISTFFWGAMFGSWLGDLVYVVTGGAYTIPPLWFNPMEDPMKMLIFSFAFGAVHIFVGMGLKAYMLIRDGKPLDALFDIGAWYLLLPGLVMMFAGGTIGTIGKIYSYCGSSHDHTYWGRAEKIYLKN